MNLAEKVRDYFRWNNFKNSWEFRGAAFIVRACFALAFVGYLITYAPRAWLWTQMTLIRAQNFEVFDNVARNGIASGDMDWTVTWVDLRPLAETDKIKTALEPYYGEVPTRLFFSLRMRALRAHHDDEADFWEMVARFRLRYDLLRCGAPDSIETMNQMLQLLKTDEKTRSLGATKDLIRRTLDFDAAHPARNNPADICLQINRVTRSNAVMVPQENWNGIRHTLRIISEMALKSDFNEKPVTPPAAPDRK